MNEMICSIDYEEEYMRYQREMDGRYDRRNYARSAGRWAGYDTSFRRDHRGRDDRRPGARGGGGARDLWWLGEREMARRGRVRAYDEAYARFDERNHPRYSPASGMQPGMGSWPTPDPAIRDDRRFSDWTRWF